MNYKEAKEKKMTPEEAIKEFESELEWAELNIYPYISKQKVEADKMAIKALEQESKWMPVSERLPEKDVEVLATTIWDEVTMAEMYSANDWYIHEGATNVKTDEIAAWMPLPEPYKAESEE